MLTNLSYKELALALNNVGSQNGHGIAPTPWTFTPLYSTTHVHQRNKTQQHNTSHQHIISTQHINTTSCIQLAEAWAARMSQC